MSQEIDLTPLAAQQYVGGVAYISNLQDLLKIAKNSPALNCLLLIENAENPRKFVEMQQIVQNSTISKRAAIYLNDHRSLPREAKCSSLSFESYLWNQKNLTFGKLIFVFCIKFNQFYLF